MILLFSILILFNAVHATTIITFTFDDGWVEHFTIANIFTGYGINATFYVNSNRLVPPRLTPSQLNRMQFLGHEIGGHTKDHTDLLTLNTSQKIDQICNDKSNLQSLNLNVNSFAFPFGNDPDNIQEILQNCGFTSARDSGGIQTGDSCNGCPFGIELPPQEPFKLRSISYRNTMDLEFLKQNVINAQLEAQSLNIDNWLIYTLHEIVNDDNPPIRGISLDLLVDFVKWIIDSGLPVATVNQVIQGAIPTQSETTTRVETTTGVEPTTQPEITTGVETTTQASNPYLGATVALSVLLGFTIIIIIVFTVCVIYYMNINKEKENVEIELAKTQDDIEKQYKESSVSI